MNAVSFALLLHALMRSVDLDMSLPLGPLLQVLSPLKFAPVVLMHCSKFKASGSTSSNVLASSALGSLVTFLVCMFMNSSCRFGREE